MSNIDVLNNCSIVSKEVEEYIYLSKTYLQAMHNHMKAVKKCCDCEEIMKCEIRMKDCQENVQCKKAEIIKMGHEHLDVNLESFLNKKKREIWLQYVLNT